MADNLNSTISIIHYCQSKDARKLCIRDFPYKASHNDHYDIGGTYTGTNPDLWFYMTTSIFSERGHLFSLFVCHRRVGNVTITVTLNGDTSTLILKSSKDNQIHHIKTACVTRELIANMKDHTVYIPVTIEIDSTQLLNPEVIRKMKIQNSLSERLFKQKTDFILESISHKQFPVHKLVLCAHSPVLRELVKNSAKTSEFLDISDEDMDLLIRFLYTGTVQNLKSIDCMRLQEMACKFELPNMFLLAQHLICEKINVDNAVDIAILANKYDLDQLWTKVCSFIRQNPGVLSTQRWKSLADVDVTKKLCAALVK